MKREILIAFVAVFGLYAMPVDAQFHQQPDESSLPGKRGPNNVRSASYPRLLPDNRMEFKVKAPDAKQVQIDLGRKYDLTKNANGEWTGITDPLTPGFHYYFLIIDGVSVADPASESFYGCSMCSSGVEIPYPAGDTRFETADVPHGDVRMKRYYSSTAGDWRRAYVYCPPGYDTSNEEFPVLYLQHGGGEDERGWSTQGRTDIIMDNLIARGEAKPMIVVMADGNSADFEKELLNDVIPMTEKNFRVKKGRENRALAGLSMGGIQTLNIGIPNLDKFGSLGVFSSGWFARQNPFGVNMDSDKYYEILKKDKDKFNSDLKVFYLTMGGPEDIAYDNCKQMRARFDEIGIRYDYFETPGGHTWPVWRESLWQFAPLLFK